MVYARSCGCIMVSASAVVSLLRYSRQCPVSSGLLPNTCRPQAGSTAVSTQGGRQIITAERSARWFIWRPLLRHAAARSELDEERAAVRMTDFQSASGARRQALVFLGTVLRNEGVLAPAQTGSGAG